MKSKELRQKQQALREEILATMKFNIGRIIALLKGASLENSLNSEIRLQDGVSFERIDDQFDRKIHGVLTDGKRLQVTSYNSFEEEEETIESFTDYILIKVLEQLEEIKTVEDVEFIK